jgi:pimeloyl-ACP methyl ester carboxylesterase
MRGAKVLRCRTDLAIDLLRATPYDPSPLLQNISATTLILRGEEDMIATAEHRGHLKGGIAGAELFSLPGQGHNSIGENPRT